MEANSSLMNQFHLGVSPDGRECLMVFVDEEHRAMKCVAEFSEFQAFVANLAQIADEMARRQMLGGGRAALPRQMIDVTAAAFMHDADDDCIKGTLVGPSGDLMGLKMSPEVASLLSRALLLATPAALAS
ncbi:MAG: hypothetical protein EXR12_17565 [Rhodospirillaceae bacterium]|nr:hypothetical protein [Rhodospirillaceae bacterium]